MTLEFTKEFVVAQVGSASREASLPRMVSGNTIARVVVEIPVQRLACRADYACLNAIQPSGSTC